MRKIQIISVNHQTHNSDDRIALNLTEEQWEQMFMFIKHNLGIEGYVHLCTCNRIELMYESADDHSEEIIGQWISKLNKSLKIERSTFQVFSSTHESIDHLLSLSIGFKSAIFGDDQILSQLKKAFEFSRNSNTLSTLLERAYQTIMRLHKSICRETDFKSNAVSLAYQALKSARLHFNSKNLQNKNALIIGAGDMAAQVVKYCPKFNFNSITITNRTQTKAENLVRKTSIEVISHQELDISQYDIIFSCTDTGYTLINDWSQIEYYVDLSLYSSQIEQVPVPNILLHQLQKLINKQNMARIESVDKVNSILEEKKSDYLAWCKSWRERALVLSLQE
jgi:glutamyl-tRNA reductase